MLIQTRLEILKENCGLNLVWAKRHDFDFFKWQKHLAAKVS
ncbi:hypothetical protein [Shewanella glacialimarina]|nr:hypothetical protein [Shewanella glacialimarina]